MTYLHAVILGIVQGLTEFLPVSSSGHLILVPHLFGWPDQGLAFDAVIHIGTLGALVGCFRAELLGFISGRMSLRLLSILAVATIPAGVAGVFLGRVIEESLRVPMVVGASTAVWAIVMWIADRRVAVSAAAWTPLGDPLERVSWGQGLAVGCAQAIALIPGTSRSGITITAALLGGIDRATAARFSFLLGIPITAAAGGAKTLELLRHGLPHGELGPLVAALLAAFASGWFAAWSLVTYLKRRSLGPFVLYRLVLAAAIFLLTL